MQTVIMAGGEGTRLRPLTCSIPKPMVSFFSKPLVQYQIESLIKQNLNDFKFTLMYKPNVIKDYFGDGSDFDAKFAYYTEDSPLGTAGSVKNACGDVDDTFLVISGDCLTDIDIGKAVAFHKEKNAKATIVLKKSKKPMDFGIVLYDEDQAITRFLEKPELKELFSDTVNTGIYIFEPEVLELIPDGVMFDFAKDVFPKMLEKNMLISGYIMDEYWCDLGNIESYIKAHEDVLSGLCAIDLPASNNSGIYAMDGAVVSNSALIEAPVFLGKDSQIKDGVKLGKYSIIGDNVVVDENASIKKGIVLQGAYIGKASKVSCAIICENAKIDSKNYVLESAVVGRKTVLCGDNQVNPKVKIWPEKWIDKNVNVSENITWGYGKKASIFTSQGIIGDLKIDFDEKTVVELAHAFADRFKGEGVLLCGSDNSEMTKCYLDIFIKTLMLNAQKVIKSDECILEVLRYGVQVLDVCGGVYFKNLKDKKIRIELIQQDGLVMNKKKIKGIERKFSISEYAMFDENSIETVETVDSLKQLYSADVKKSIAMVDKNNNHVFGMVKSNDEQTQLILPIIKDQGYRFKLVEKINRSDIDGDIKKHGCELFMQRDKNDDIFEIYLSDLTIKSNDSYLMMLYLLHIKRNRPETIYLTSLMPDGILHIAKANGVKYHVCKYDELFELSGEQFARLYNDSIYCQIKLMDYLNQTNDIKQDFFDEIPVQYIKEKYLNVELKDVGMVINEINSKDYTKQAIEGIKIYHNNGWGLVYPADDASKIIIKAQGSSEEYAKEICDFHFKEIKEILKNNKYD
jgi:mannose-1-phosphate guanylyltransferase / phosphomannomutase